MAIYESLIRPLLFALTPDHSHQLAHAALRFAPPWQLAGALQKLKVDDARLRTRFAGIDLPNPVGLAAGFDKDCELMAALSCLGFGFLTVGSIMPEPRPGHPFPRLVRYPERQSMADAMGLPSAGRAYCVDRLRRRANTGTPLFANIGGFSGADIAASFFAVEPYVDAVEISLICPNIKPGEHFDELALLRDVLDRIEGRRKPAVVRIPNDTVLVDDRLAALVEQCVASGVAGLKVAGGRPVDEPRLGVKKGTLHGRPIFERALANVERTAKIARGRIPIKGNGGVSTGADLAAMLRAGATCVDIYSAFVFRGWSAARKINRELLALMPAGTAKSTEPMPAQSR